MAGTRQPTATMQAKSRTATATQASQGRQASQGEPVLRTEAHRMPMTNISCQASGLKNQTSPASYTGQARLYFCTPHHSTSDSARVSGRDRRASTSSKGRAKSSAMYIGSTSRLTGR